MAHPFYTIGHGTRPLDDFVALLRDARGDGARRCPHRAALAHQSAL